MFVQIKAIRKGVKPPIWRRACVPLGINFAKMAFILETLLELPVTDRYEFEFFREKDRLIERNNAETTRADYQFTYRDAVQSSVNERLMEKTWFTFRVKNGEDPPQYRVEVEKHADSGIVSDKTPYGCPMILREVSYKGDLYWTSPEEINRKLIESCYLCEGEAEYPSFASVYERSMQGRGIIFSGKLESRENVIADSMQKVFAKVADSIMSVRAEPGKAAPGGTDAPDLVAPSSQNTAPVRKSGKAKSVTVDSMLNAYTREALMEIADECGCERVLSASRAADTAGKAAKKMTKPKMAYELARYLLEPGVMRRRLLELDEEELDAFEAAVQKGGRFYPSIEEEMLLDRVFSLCYLAEFSDDTVQVPEDAAAIYQVICSNGYRDYHRKARWLIDCIRAFALLYVVGNVELLYELYCRTDRFKADRVEFDDILAKIPADRMECVKIGRRIVAKKAASNEFYKVIEQGQRDVPYYIPSAREILDYAGKGYPASDAAYKKLSDFFRYEFDLEEAECNNLCCRAFSIFASGRMLSDFMGVLDQRGVILRSQKQVERFARIAMEANNSTRMYGLKGHTPIEMHDFMEDAPIPARPKIKVYPNDPCPCGSGKKYKKCCGRGL